MIKEKIQDEMFSQRLTQRKLVEKVNNLNKEHTLTPAQLSNFLSGKKTISHYHIESIFEVLKIKLIRIL
jgi:transcriptional regulator with XRE-family HTH domain